MIGEVVDYLNSGGFVSYPLVVLFLGIVYSIGYRFAVFYPGKRVDARSLFRSNEQFPNSIQNQYLSELMSIKKTEREDVEGEIEERLVSYEIVLDRFSSVLSTSVVLAPLLGLLGTVVGMIETFSSLSNAALFSSTGGIAGGISQALVSTQLGLVVAIPGVFLARYLKKLERKTRSDFYQINELYLQKQMDIK